MSEKIELDTDKRVWHPSPLAGQIVLVTTVDENGDENVAPKSWVSMFAFEPPILGFGCNIEHQTAKNIFATGEFTVNVPHHALAEKIWGAADLPHPRRVRDLDLTTLPGLRVKPPRIAECPAHFECVFDSAKAWGKEVAIFGRIVSYTQDELIRRGTLRDWYRRLGLFVYLEDKTYGVVRARSIGDR